MNIVVFGMGYVGLVTAGHFANAGHRVYGIETDPRKLSTLKDGKSPFFEPGLDELLGSTDKLSFHSELEAIEPGQETLAFICVGTPQSSDGSADTSQVFECVKTLTESNIKNLTIVLKSTVPVGTADQVLKLLEHAERSDIKVANNPEFTRQGQAVSDFAEPDRIVIGSFNDDKLKQTFKDLYSPFAAEENILFMSHESAELCKYAANSFLATKISFANELSELCLRTGANTDDVIKGFASDHRINPAFFGHGLGFGGSCFPKDLSALIHLGEQQDLPMEIVRSVREVNSRQPHKLFRKVKAEMGDLNGKTFALWGLSFKANTDDQRHSPAKLILNSLADSKANVRCYDPNIKSLDMDTRFVSVHETIEETLEGAEALIVVTDHQEFAEFSISELREKLSGKFIFDGRNLLDSKQITLNQLKHIKL